MPPRILAALGLLVALTLAVGPVSASPDRTSPDPEQAQARRALAEVERLFSPSPAQHRARSRRAGGGETRDATLALRALWRSKASLPPGQRRLAERHLARPVGGETGFNERSIDGAVTSDCTLPTMCVHYTGDDGARDQVDPAYLALTKQVLAEVAGTYQDVGLRTPLPDAGQGGNPKMDVYLMDLWPDLYGYCASDGDLVEGQAVYPVYCVLDNDFVDYLESPEDALKVTVAHEYFHAVQAAYDWLEDDWFIEGGAAWVEDEVYPAIDDNLQYLDGSQLVIPRSPLDNYAGWDDAGEPVDWYDVDDETTPSTYGSWIFFRHLSERWQARAGEPLVLMRKMLERADATGPDDHSVLAVANVVAAHPSVYPGGFAQAYNDFAVANRLPRSSYAEGHRYPRAVAPAMVRFDKRTPGVRTRGDFDRLHHLSSYTVRVVPHRSFRARSTRLRFVFDLPGRSANPGVTVRSFGTDGTITTTPVALDAAGDATRSFGFSARAVRYLEVTVSNASIRYTRCGSWTHLACGGYPRDDGKRHAFTGQLRR